MHDIGIVGTGIAGLHLALYLQQRGLVPTLYSELRPDEMRAARLPSTPALFGTVRGHMRDLGVAHWDAPDTAIHAFDFGIKGMPEFSFHVPFRPAAQFIDMRVYLPRLLEDFAARGGAVVTSGALDGAAVAQLGERHDLVVVASGRGGLADMFPRVPERSPHTTPQRRLLGGLFRGIRCRDERCFTQRIVAGAGEVCEFQMLTHGGPVGALLIFAVPGGPLEGITQLRHEDDPGAFDRAVVDFLGKHAPDIRARIDDPAAFGALGPRDVYQGGVIPVVRHGVVELRPGRHAIALGDAHVTMDPLTAQGANAAGKAAWRLGGLIAGCVAEGRAFDAAFCALAERDLWNMLQPFVEWNNAAVGPPPPHVFALIAAAARNPAIAMEFTANFDDPRRQWEILRSPEATAVFIQR